MVYFPRDAHFTSTLIAEMLRFPNGTHDDQVDALAWLGLMMSEFAVFQAPVVKKTSWRDRLEYLVKSPRNKSPMSA
jgi:hypothetical protein